MTITDKQIQAHVNKAFSLIMKHDVIKELKSDYAIQKAAGLSNGSLAAIRKSKSPSYSTIVKLCHVCGIQAHSLLKGL